ncbi:Gag-Pol polyprotein [Bienertia sinuspersici]
MEVPVTLKFWHGGLFKRDSLGVLVYVGRTSRTIAVDSDKLGWWDLLEEAKNCGGYSKIDSIQYHIPGQPFESGLRNVYSDTEVREMVALALECRVLNLYVVHGVDEPELVAEETISHTATQNIPLPKCNPRKKLIPKRAPKEVKNIPLPTKDASTSAAEGPQSTCIMPTPSLNETVNPNIPHICTQASQAPQISKNSKEKNTEQIKTNTQQFETNTQQFETTPVNPDYEWIDPRPDSPVTWEDFLKLNIHESEESEGTDPEYEPVFEGDYDSEEGIESGYDGYASEQFEEFVCDEFEGEEGDDVLEDLDGPDSETSDEEYQSAREKARGFNKQLFKVAKQLEQEAAAVGKVGNTTELRQVEEGPSNRDGPLSDYEESDEDIHTPTSSDGDESGQRRRSKRGDLVSDKTDFSVFEWKVGQRFANRDKFKNAVVTFGILQGRNLSFVVSNKNRGQRVGVTCSTGCPFKVYASWDSRRATFVVKSVMSEHTCTRTMERNRQLKSPWVAEQFLEVFKARPHWPAKDIMQTIRLAYKVLVKKDFAYKSILTASALVLPHAEHRHCARHVFAHWHKSYKGDEYKCLFWNIAKAYNEADYTDAMQQLENVSEAAADAFRAYNPKVFCRAFMKTTTRCDAITNNMAETFNGYIIQARNKHLIYMLEDIRASLMQRLALKKQEMEKSTSMICPRVQTKLEKNKDEAAKCHVMPSTSTIFQVNYYLDSLTVDLEARSCTCRRWDMCGIPCCHAVAAIFFCHQKAEDYVDVAFTREVYLKAYSNPIPPCEGERHWPKVDFPIDPPPIKIGPGRPRKNRRKDPHELAKKPGKLSKHGLEMTCSICKAKGHNKRKCPRRERDIAAEQQQPSKRPRGRPKASTQPDQVVASTEPDHRSATAEPARLGRGGRVIRGGKGSRGASRSGLRSGSNDASGIGRVDSTSGTRGVSSGRGGRGRGRGRNRVSTLYFSQYHHIYTDL